MRRAVAVACPDPVHGRPAKGARHLALDATTREPDHVDELAASVAKQIVDVPVPGVAPTRCQLAVTVDSCLQPAGSKRAADVRVDPWLQVSAARRSEADGRG